MYWLTRRISSQVSCSASAHLERRRSSLARASIVAVDAASSSRSRSSRLAVASRHDAIAIALDHRGRAADDVAEIVGEVRVEPRQDRLVGEVRVLAERHLAHHEVAERVEAEDR